MFNPDTNRCEDVSRAIAQDLGLEGRDVPSLDFIDRHIGTDRRPALRLALTQEASRPVRGPSPLGRL